MHNGVDVWTGRKILITGGAGYLASNLVRRLGDAACHIVRLDREGAAFPSSPGKARIEDVAGDIRDRSLWERLLDGTDAVFHFAAQTSVYVADESPSADLEINVAPMVALLETCSRRGYRPAVLFAGTATECGMTTRLPVDETQPDRPITIYDLHKLMAENYLKYFVARGALHGAVLRLANVYGPGPKSSSAERGVLNMMVRKALRGDALTVYGEGNHLRDYVYVEDVAAAFCAARAAIERISGLHFVIGSGRGHTIAEAIAMVAERVARTTGRRVPMTHTALTGAQSPIETRDFVADATRFTRATGWRARVSLEEGIDRTIDYFLRGEGRE